MGRPPRWHPVSGSCASPRQFKPEGGDLISSEAVFRGKLLTLRSLTRDPKAAARWADLPPGGPSWARAGAHRPERSEADLPRGLDTYREGPACERPADMLPASEEVCGGSGLEGPKWPLLLGGGRAIPSPCVPGEAITPRRHGILRPALGLAGQTAHLGNDPGRGRGSLPG